MPGEPVTNEQLQTTVEVCEKFIESIRSTRQSVVRGKTNDELIQASESVQMLCNTLLAFSGPPS